MSTHGSGSRRRSFGFSYAEALVATVVLAVGLVPATNALRTAVTGSVVYGAQAAGVRALANKMEEVVARPYPVLDFAGNLGNGDETVPISSPRNASNPGLDPGPGYSDANFTVYIYRTDGSKAKAQKKDQGMLWITVVDANGQKLDTIVTR